MGLETVAPWLPKNDLEMHSEIPSFFSRHPRVIMAVSGSAGNKRLMTYKAVWMSRLVSLSSMIRIIPPGNYQPFYN